MKTRITLFVIVCLGVFSKAYTQPMANFGWSDPCSAVTTFNDSSICNGCTIASWSWDFGDGHSSSSQNPLHTYAIPGSYQVTLIVTDNVGNTSDSTIQIFTNTGNLQAIISGSTCVLDECVPLNVNISGGMPPYTYQWELNAIPVGFQPVFEWCPPYESGTYSINVIDLWGCVASSNILELAPDFRGTSDFENETCGFSDGMASITITNTNFPVNYLWSPGGETTSAISNLDAGFYTVTISNTNGCSIIRNFNISDTCGNMSGRVFLDGNQNNLFDIGEQPFFYGTMQITGNTVYETDVNSSGAFMAQVNNGSYTTNFVPYHPYYTVSPLNHVSQINNSTPADTFNFAVVPIQDRPDLEIYILPINQARPGFPFTISLIVKNVGTDTLSGQIKFSIPAILTMLYSTPNHDTYINDTMTWSFIDFSPLQTSTYYITVQVPAPPAVNINDYLDFDATIFPVQGDMTPSNNYYEHHQLVSGSYDPNDKWVSLDTIAPSQISNGEYLNYRIRFQNTGTDTAFTIAVRDTLDQNLDWSSLQMINASHAYTLSTRGGNALEWKFNSILLPDSNTNEPLSHGYIFYRIKPKNTLTIGDSIANTAAIYFDFNPPVITNTAYSVVDETTSIIENTGEMALTVFPNPSSGDFTVQFISQRSGEYIFELTDVSGRMLESKTFFHDAKTELRPNLKLAKGMYLVNISNEAGTITRKVLVK